MKTEDEKQSESKEEHDDEGAQSPDLTDGDDTGLDSEPSSEEVAQPLSCLLYTSPSPRDRG